MNRSLLLQGVWWWFRGTLVCIPVAIVIALTTADPNLIGLIFATAFPGLLGALFWYRTEIRRAKAGVRVDIETNWQIWRSIRAWSGLVFLLSVTMGTVMGFAKEQLALYVLFGLLLGVGSSISMVFGWHRWRGYWESQGWIW